MPIIVRIARWLAPDFFAAAARTGRPHLLTIPYSHFVELARWALQLVGADFTEADYAPLQHVLPVLAARHAPTRAGEARACAGSPTAVPLLVLPDGRLLPDSWAIGAASGLPRVPEGRLAAYEEQLGPLARQWSYYHLLKPANAPHWDALVTRGRHWLWRLAYWLLLRGPLRARLSGAFRAGDDAAMTLCRQRLRELLPNLAKRLPPSLPGGGFDGYMHGPALSLEDLALAALAAPLVSPADYCEGRFAFALDAAEASDAEYRRELEEWRQTDVGRYALWMYGRHRMRPLPEALRLAHAL